MDKKPYVCNKCNYSTFRNNDFKKHLNTEKHKNRLKNEFIFTCECGKNYKTKSGLSKHKQICKKKVDTVTIPKDLLDKLIKSQSVTNITNNNKNITNNNKNIVNINLFLNEECSNAMSIQDFAKNLKLTIEDLNLSKKDTLITLLLKNLKPLSLTERPIHHTKNKAWYIKDNKNGWEEDNGDKVINTTEFGINKKWATKFEEKYPNWQQDIKLHDKYLKISSNSTGVLSNKDKNNVLKKISSEVTI